MKLLFKQRFFSWFDSYDIYNEDGQVIYQVEGKLSWGHKLVIYDANGNEVGYCIRKGDDIYFLNLKSIRIINILDVYRKNYLSLLHTIILTTTDGILMELLLNGIIQLWMKAMILLRLFVKKYLISQILMSLMLKIQKMHWMHLCLS